MNRIFVKGLMNIHTLAAYVYEKGPQTLVDTICEVEKLQAELQLTASLLTSSTVNVMSHKGEQCLQCQELGHITCHCPNVCCFEGDEYGHIAVDCPDRISPSHTLAHHKRQHPYTRHPTRSISWHHWDMHRHSRSRSQSQSHRYCSYSCKNSHRSHSRSHHRCHHRSTSRHHHSNTYRYCCDTPHRRSSSHRSLSAHFRDCSRPRSCTSYNPRKNTSSKSFSSSSKTTAKPQGKTQKRVMIDDPQSDYYSSDDTSSDCEDDLD